MQDKPKVTTRELKWLLVSSSAITAMTYDSNDQRLYVEFRSGNIYIYVGVSRQRFTVMQHARSKGAYLNSKIKPLYNCIKIL